MNKREARKRVREIIRCLEHSEDFRTNNCTVAERKLEMLKEAPALVYELGCIHSYL